MRLQNRGYGPVPRTMSGLWYSHQVVVSVILRMSAYIVNSKVTIRFGYMMSFSENIPTSSVLIIANSSGGMMTSSLYHGYNEWLTGLNF